MAAEHLGAEVGQQHRLARREAARDRDDGRADPLGAGVEAEPAGEQPVAVGVVDDHAGRTPAIVMQRAISSAQASRSARV